MLAKDLKPGDLFRVVGHVDPEGPTRVCLTNDPENGLRFGFPAGSKPGLTSGYWCFMGELCEVELIDKGE